MIMLAEYGIEEGTNWDSQPLRNNSSRSSWRSKFWRKLSNSKGTKSNNSNNKSNITRTSTSAHRNSSARNSKRTNCYSTKAGTWRTYSSPKKQEIKVPNWLWRKWKLQSMGSVRRKTAPTAGLITWQALWNDSQYKSCLDTLEKVRVLPHLLDQPVPLLHCLCQIQDLRRNLNRKLMAFFRSSRLENLVVE